MLRKMAFLMAFLGLAALSLNVARAYDDVEDVPYSFVSAYQDTEFGREYYTAVIYPMLGGKYYAMIGYRNVDTLDSFLTSTVYDPIEVSLQAGHGVFSGPVRYDNKACKFRLEVWQGTGSSNHAFSFRVMDRKGKVMMERSGLFEEGSSVLLRP